MPLPVISAFHNMNKNINLQKNSVSILIETLFFVWTVTYDRYPYHHFILVFFQIFTALLFFIAYASVSISF